MTTRPATHTELAGSTPDRIDIRGTDLVNELMGKLTFTEMFLFHLLGRRPTPSRSGSRMPFWSRSWSTGSCPRSSPRA